MSNYRYLLLLLPILLQMNSCTLFDKDLEQDKHIAVYNYQMLATLDSVDNPKARIVRFKQILDSIDADVALITPRKKNVLVRNCYSFISDEFCNMGDYKEAVIYSDLYIRMDSTSATGYFLRATALDGAGLKDSALVDYNRVIEINDKFAPAYFNSALIYEDIGEYEKALSSYNKAMKSKPYNAKDILINRGNIHNMLNNPQKALEDYSIALALDSMNAIAYSNRGNTYSNMKRYDIAIKDYTSSLRYAPNWADTYNKRAYSYELKGRLDSAKMDYQQARILNAGASLSQKELTDAGLKRIATGKKAKR